MYSEGRHRHTAVVPKWRDAGDGTAATIACVGKIRKLGINGGRRRVSGRATVAQLCRVECSQGSHGEGAHNEEDKSVTSSQDRVDA